MPDSGGSPSSPQQEWPISVKRLSSGYYHVRGPGPENWAQPPEWPCDAETLRDHASSGACDDFIRAALDHGRSS